MYWVAMDVFYLLLVLVTCYLNQIKIVFLY